ncbi:MAG: phosphotransferase [Planctomycetes bacterium]|nr:phosphotransferase [Planctomycetota bacterium]
MARALGIEWIESDPRRPLPPLDEALSGWDVTKKRRDRWNARRAAGDRDYHLKWFFHGPWSRPALREWRGARRVAALGVPTVVPVGWGRHGRGSFVVLEGSPGFPADAWREHGVAPERLARLAAELAAHAARLHDSGLCHRDLNVYHLLVDAGGLRLIDVGRVARFVRRRWIVKDLASLLYTARREGFPAWACRAFLRRYLAWTRRRWSRRRLIAAVAAKAERIRRHARER